MNGTYDPNWLSKVPAAGVLVAGVEGDEPSLDPANGKTLAAPTIADTLRAKILDREQLRTIPPARYLIQDVLDLDSESWLIGKSQAFKSFVAIDWACHVATDTQWRGRKIRTGPVLYVVAEGVKGFAKRVDAWEIVHGIKVTKLYTLPAPVQAKGAGAELSVSAQWRALCEVAAEMQPVLIVLDTQARMTVGLEENSNTAMGIWTEAIRQMREATSACVLVVHHLGRSGDDARGASALDGAQDTEWKVVRTDMRKRLAQLRMDKNKDGDNDQDFDFEAVVVEVGVDEEGDTVTSLALRPITAELAAYQRGESEDPTAFTDYDHDLKLTENQKEVLALLDRVVTEHGDTPAGILRMVNERRRERAIKTATLYEAMPRTSLTRALDALEGRDLVVRLGKTGGRFASVSKVEGDESSGGETDGEAGGGGEIQDPPDIAA